MKIGDKVMRSELERITVERDAMSAWHENCILRDDVRTGTLTLADFAAELYGVRTGDAPNVYRLPNLFFERTYLMEEDSHHQKCWHS